MPGRKPRARKMCGKTLSLVDTPDSRFCDRCGRPLSRYLRADARFCDEGCRGAAWRHERRRQTDGLYAIEDDVQRAVRAILGERLDRGESR